MHSALGIGQASKDSKNRPDLLHDGSDYSEGQRKLALGLEDLKFARAIGEGETPSTMVTEQDVALTKEKEIEQCAAGAASSVPPMQSGRVLKKLMDQSGRFELAPQPYFRSGDRTRTPSPKPAVAEPKPYNQEMPPPPPLTVIPPTPPESTSDSGLSRPVPMSKTTSSMTMCEENEEGGVETPKPASSPVAPPSPPPLFNHTNSAPAPLETVPLASSSAAPGTPLPVLPPGRGLRVLVVDDDMITRTLMSRMLTRLGCVVTTAENGKIALEKILDGVIPPGIVRGEPGTGMGMSTGMPPHEVEQIPDEEHVYIFDIVFLDNQMVSYCQVAFFYN